MKSVHRTIPKIVIITLLLTLPVMGQGWWNSHWSFRRAVVYAPKIKGELGRFNSPDGCLVRFLTGGQIKSDGSDIRIIGQGGREKKFRILAIGPGDMVRIAIEARGSRRQRYYIYYGNPKAKSLTHDWKPRSGLLVETWKYAGGSIGTSESIRKTLDRAGREKPIGSAYVSAVFIPGNIFNSVKQTCNLYSGTLVCREEGEYRFAISSYDASALFIDDKLVVSWPGRHRWVGDIRHQGKAVLKRGLHNFAMYHVNLQGKGGAVAAWKTPASRAFRILLDKNFLPIVRGYLGTLEKKDNRFTADFIYKPEEFANMQKATLHKFQFIALTGRRRNIPGEKYIWDFGDGQVALGREVEHVFLHEGIFPVTLQRTVGRSSDTIVNKIFIATSRMDYRRRPVKLRTFAGDVSRYDYSQLRPGDALTLMNYFLIVNNPKEAIKVGRDVVSHAEGVDKDKFARIAIKLANLLIDFGGNYASAAYMLQNARDKLDPSSSQFKLLTASAVSLFINTLGKGGLAEQMLGAAGKPVAVPGNDAQKAWMIAWGDLYRFRGNRKLAEEYYTKAQKKVQSLKNFAKSGGFAAAAEDYIRRKKYAKAREIINRWQWEIPTERLGGYSEYLRYRLYYAQGQFEQGRLLARIIKKIAPFSLYAQRMGSS